MNTAQSAFPRLAAVILFLGAAPAGAEGSRQNAEIVIPEESRTTYESWGFAPAIKIDNVVYVSGVVAGLEGEGSYEERYANGLRSALRHIAKVLAEAGASMDDVIDITTFHTDLQRQLQTAVAVRMAEMKPPHPTWTAVGTTALAVPGATTEIKVVAHIGN